MQPSTRSDRSAKRDAGPAFCGRSACRDDRSSGCVSEFAAAMAFDRPARLEFSATSKLMDLAISLRFDKSGSGTELHGTYEPRPKGLMALLFPLLRPMIRRDMSKQHQNLKSYCESQTH